MGTGLLKTTRLLAVLCGGLVPVGLAAPAAAADPPGNNGTVKVDGVEFDDAPDNQPHVGCVFQVDFYGFDEGDLDASVTFKLVPPTGNDVDIVVDDVFIGEDAAGGGTDLDASATYDLTAALVTVPHDQQGWHVRLTVHADGSIGADTKFKEYWVKGCGGNVTTSTTSTTKPDGPHDTTTTSTPGDTTTSSVPGGGTPTTGPDGSTPTTPGGSSSTTAVDSATVTPPAGADGHLPDTGSNVGPIAAAGAILAAVGAGVALASRRVGRDPS